MAQSIRRRDFLTTAAISSGSAIAGLAGTLAPRCTRAIEPVRRPAGGNFKFSLAAFSYRDLFSGGWSIDKPLTMEKFLIDCANMQLDGAELTSYYFPKSFTPKYLRDLKRQAFLLGLDVSGTAVGNNFCHPLGSERDSQIQLVKRWVDHAEILGAPVIRIFAGVPNQGQSPAEAHRLIVEAIEECCNYAGEHGVTLALENHGGPTSTPEGMLPIIRDVQSPWFGVNFDTGNFHGADVYAELAQIAPYAVNVQIKSVIAPAGGPAQPTDYKRLAKMLRDVGYRGYIVLEYEEGEDPRAVCPKLIGKLREAFA